MYGLCRKGLLQHYGLLFSCLLWTADHSSFPVNTEAHFSNPIPEDKVRPANLKVYDLCMEKTATAVYGLLYLLFTSTICSSSPWMHGALLPACLLSSRVRTTSSSLVLFMLWDKTYLLNPSFHLISILRCTFKIKFQSKSLMF